MIKIIAVFKLKETLSLIEHFTATLTGQRKKARLKAAATTADFNIKTN